MGEHERKEMEKNRNNIEEKNKDEGDTNKSEEAEVEKNEEDLTIDTVDLIREMKNLENSEYDTRPAKLRSVNHLTKCMAKKWQLYLFHYTLVVRNFSVQLTAAVLMSTPGFGSSCF